MITTTNAFNVTTLSNQTICDITAAYPLLDAGNPGAPSYQWFLNSTPIAGATSQTYQTMQAGTYSVQVGTGTCAGNGNMVLTVNATPVVTLTNLTNIPDTLTYIVQTQNSFTCFSIDTVLNVKMLAANIM